jgi:hypothetical protein
MNNLSLRRMFTGWCLPSAATLLLLLLAASSTQATPPVGFSAEAFRGPFAANVNEGRWDPSPLFSMLIQSSSDNWGYDVVLGTGTLAPADATGKPSQSGWHDHPTAVTIVLIVQGTLWVQVKPNLNCLTAYPAGSVFLERRDVIHNGYNLDPKVPAVWRYIHFIERSETATKRDQPDQVTGDPNTASPPPPACAPADSLATADQKSTKPSLIFEKQ